METNIAQKLNELEQKMDEIYVSVEKTRKSFMWTLVITAVVIILPLIGLLFAVPSFISSYTDSVGSIQGIGL
ncbi:MAG: hypothetical protein WC835_01260 [Candidatus Paceibacterota bacterium]|jgi:hypothetical protein